MHYIIIGGDAAGMSAAMQLLKHDKEAKITILEAGDTYSYGQCGLPYYISDKIQDVTDLVARTPYDYREFGMKAHIYTKVTGICPEKQEVTGVHVRTGEPFTYTYDRLLIATGARPVMLAWPGNDLKNIHTIKTLDDATTIKDQLGKDVEQVTIIGAGYIGIEMAEAFAESGLSVRMLVRGKQIMKIFDEDMAELIMAEARKHGIAIHLEEDTKGFLGDNFVEQVETDQGLYDTDLVLIATGVTPNSDFITDTTIARSIHETISTNSRMETSFDNIYAAGDCTTAYHRLLKKPVYIPLGTTANKQGRIAGLNMAGKVRDHQGIVGTSILQFMDLTLGKTGLSEKEAKEADIPYQAISIKASHIAGYYPDALPIHVKLVYQAHTRQLLGGQIIGEAGVDKRIDVLVVALTNEMTIDDLEDLDLAYAPPYNGVWDPLQKVARKAADV